MRDEIIEILKKRSISYGELLATLKCDNSELAKVISEMEDVDIIKIGKLYNLIDNTVFSRGTVVIRNGNPYLKTSEESKNMSENRTIILPTLL